MGERAVSPSSILSEAPLEHRQVNDLCDVCQRMRIDYLIDYMKSGRKIHENFITLPTHLEHGELMEYGTPSQISHRLNCSFCRLVLRLLPRESCSSMIPEAKSGPSTSTPVVIECVLDAPYSGFNVVYAGEDRGRIELGSPDEAFEYTEDECLQGVLQPTYAFRPFQLDPNQVRLWIDECITSHGRHVDQHISPRYQVPIDLIFVDVNRGCLVKGSSSSRYIALSYVWGHVARLQTTIENRSELEHDGALFRRYPDLPTVVQDAILLVRMLGEQFLWVDALCIEQDNIAQKHTQIAQMDIVYSQTFLTVVAFSGSNAAACLPGVRLGTRIDAFVKGLVKCHELYTYPAIEADYVAYETRGWTLQERLLSTRCLYFTANMVFYTCHSQLRSDKEISEDTQQFILNKFVNLTEHIDDIEWCWSYSDHMEDMPHFKVYASLVSEYTRRDLSYPKDILPAFSGIMSVLQQYTGSRSLSGLLESFLDHCLLWIARPDCVLHRNRHFPSWSWAGWTGPCGYRLGPLLHPVISSLPAVHFNIKSEIQSFQSRYETPYRTVRRPRNTVEPINDDTDKVGDGQDVLLFESWATSLRSFRAINLRQYLNGSDRRNNHSDEFLLDLIGIPSSTFITCDCFMLYDLEDRHCGILYGLEALKNDQNRDRELVLLSRVQPSVEAVVSIKEPFGVPLYQSLFDHAVFEPTELCLLNVMLIEWTDGLAERLTIGHVHETAWSNARPERKRIKLY